jgi:hypothetical protein
MLEDAPSKLTTLLFPPTEESVCEKAVPVGVVSGFVPATILPATFKDTLVDAGFK